MRKGLLNFDRCYIAAQKKLTNAKLVEKPCMMETNDSVGIITIERIKFSERRRIKPLPYTDPQLF